MSNRHLKAPPNDLGTEETRDANDARGLDNTYAPSIGSTDGHKEEADSDSDNDSDSDSAAPTELQKLLHQALPEYARIERARAHDLRQFERLQKRHDEVVEKGATLGQQLQDLKAKLLSSDAILTDMHHCLAQFLERHKQADE